MCPLSLALCCPVLYLLLAGSYVCFSDPVCVSAYLYRQLFVRDGDKNAEAQASQRLQHYGGIGEVLKKIQTEATVSCPRSQRRDARYEPSYC